MFAYFLHYRLSVLDPMVYKYKKCHCLLPKSWTIWACTLCICIAPLSFFAPISKSRDELFALIQKVPYAYLGCHNLCPLSTMSFCTFQNMFILGSSRNKSPSPLLVVAWFCSICFIISFNSRWSLSTSFLELRSMLRRSLLYLSLFSAFILLLC